jgi:DNA-binding NtrC family response regulator
MKKRVLIVDDEPNLHYSFQRALDAEFEIRSAFDGEQALAIVEREPVDAILLDLKLPGLGGLEVLERVRAIRPEAAVFVMSAFATTETVIRATALSARDFIPKPVDVPSLRRMLREAMADAEGDRGGLEAPEGVAGLIGRSRVMLELYKQIGRAAAADATVLITGESGTGKELVARAIHHHGKRRDGPFVALNCAAIPAELLESELFGHERGAFTGATARRPGKFELAHGGTLLLDEVGDMAPPLQAKLLRVLQTREVTPLGGSEPRTFDVRVIASTNADLEGRVARGSFREDLYYRLNVCRIQVPPLRERGDDVLLLAETFLARESRRLARPLDGFAPDAERKLLDHSWPGNVRELENAIAQACLRARGSRVTAEDLVLGRIGPGCGEPAEPIATGTPSDDRYGLAAALRRLAEALPGKVHDAVEETLYRTALEATGGNQVRAAKLLGVSRNVLRHRMAKYSLF